MLTADTLSRPPEFVMHDFPGSTRLFFWNGEPASSASLMKPKPPNPPPSPVTVLKAMVVLLLLTQAGFAILFAINDYLR